MKRKLFLAIILGSFAFCISGNSYAQLMKDKEVFTHTDTLRGSDNENRDWWDVIRYDIKIKPDYDSKTIEGTTKIVFKSNIRIHLKKSKKGSLPSASVQISRDRKMQIDIQQPLIVDSITRTVYKNITPLKSNEYSLQYKLTPVPEKVNFTRDSNTIFIIMDGIEITQYNNVTKLDSIIIYYHGTPREAMTPPWDGGWIWKKDKQDRPWMSVACQGLGASVWYPCKDYQGDEPDNGASLTITIPDSLVAVSNGKLISKLKNNTPNTPLGDGGFTDYTWRVKNPINNYNIIPYIGKYVNFTDTFMGEKGKLNLSYWVLDYNLDKAKEQFKQVKLMLRAFEYWFGPYPFYEDDYKLVEAPHLGMEHQSAIAYGNQFKNGYMGRDLSFSGWGKKWDYIIVHESGHEWFGNSITTKDIADMWVHEGFTTYSETLFTEFYFGKNAADEYNMGMRFNVLNNKNIISPYGVNKEGSEDMYFKGSNMIHTIRHSLNNDSLFRKILRGLNKTFYHQTVTTQQIETYINRISGMNFTPVFNQYLRTTKLPELEYVADTIQNLFKYKWNNTVDSFNLRLVLQPSGRYLTPGNEFQTITLNKEEMNWIIKKGISKQFYIKEKQIIN